MEVKTILPLFIVIIFIDSILGQNKFNFDVGVGLNYSKLFLEKTNADIIDTYTGGAGFNSDLRLGYKYSKRIKFSFEPSFIITNSIDNLDTKVNSIFFNTSLKSYYYLSKNISIGSGIIFQNLVRLSLSKKGFEPVIISGFAKNKTFFNPIIGINYSLKNLIEMELSGIYFTRNLFNAGAEDFNGNIVGPFQTFNHQLKFTVWFKLF